VNIKIAAIGLLAIGGMAWAAPDLNESFNSLKTAVEAKDVAKVKAMAGPTAKEAKELSAEAKPDDANAEEAWKGRVEFAKGAADYADYALSITAIGATTPADTIALMDLLIEQNPKSKYIDDATPSYLAALQKEGAAKVAPGAEKIAKLRPENEDALYALSANNPAYAAKLVQVMRSKAKPEGVAEADWNRKKESMIANGMYFQAMANCSKQNWGACDSSAKAAEPFVKSNPQLAGPLYFYLGVANFQLATLTQDKNRIQTAVNYSKQAAAIPGPMQAQANQNVAAMTKALTTPAGARR
jgi:hypothetical protein